MSGKLFIDGAWRVGGGETFVSTAPANLKVLWAGNMASTQDTNDAIDAAVRAGGTWRLLTIEQRLDVIQRFTELLKENKQDLTAAIAHETGKPLWDAATEAGAMAGKAAVSLTAYNERTGTSEKDLSGTTLRIAHRPHGVIAVIGPFNFPGHLPNGHIIPALIAGNTIVFKPSELTPLVAEKTLLLWEQAGLPKGVINLVHGGREIAEHLIDHKDIKGILFTGGIHAGRAIHKRLGGHPDKILALELGGNNPLIVWDVKDKDAAAHIILRSVYITSGQRCTCSKRLIIPEGKEGDATLAALQAVLDQVIVDAPDAQPEPFMGPLVSDKAAAGVLAAQTKLREEGGVSLRDCTTLNNGAAFLSPGIIDVTAIKNRRDEEIFGPLLQVIRVKDFDQAIDVANDTEFGLAAGLISDQHQYWDRFSVEIDAGIVNWNRQTTGASGAAPFGGPGLSGNHRPAGFYSADYCAWPMASLIASGEVTDGGATPGLKNNQ